MYFIRIKNLSARQKISLILLIFGAIFFGSALFAKNYQKSRERILSFSEIPKLKTVCFEDDLPVKISIPSLKIELAVTPAAVSGELWEISQTGASYLIGSGVPGKVGNVVIYGHNLRKIFGSLSWIRKNSEIKVENKKGKSFIYEVIETKTVSSKQIEILLPSEEPRLTLYTCAGPMDLRRFIVVAKLK